MYLFCSLFIPLSCLGITARELYDLYCAAVRYCSFAASSGFLERGVYRCPHCGAVHSISRHGSYTRRIICLNHNDCFVTSYVKVQRFYCCSCNHTFSLIPDFLIPWSPYALDSILRVLKYYFTEKSRCDEAIAAGKRKGYRGLKKATADHFGISVSLLNTWLAKLDSERLAWRGGKMMSTAEFLDFVLNYSVEVNPGYGVFSFAPPSLKGYSAFSYKFWRSARHSFMRFRKKDVRKEELVALPGYISHLPEAERRKFLDGTCRTVKALGWFEPVFASDGIPAEAPLFSSAMPWEEDFTNKAAGKAAV